MCSHLDTILKDDKLKVILHQDFWRHRRNCVRCSGRVKPSNPVWQQSHCPLEHLVTRPELPPASASTKKGGLRQTVIAPVKGKVALARELEFMPRRPAAPGMPLAKRSSGSKKGPSEQELREMGLVKVTYEIDDDFDGAAKGTGVIRTVWIEDFSRVEWGVEGLMKIQEDAIYEEIVIGK